MVAHKKEAFDGKNGTGSGAGQAERDIDAINEDTYETVGTQDEDTAGISGGATSGYRKARSESMEGAAGPDSEIAPGTNADSSDDDKAVDPLALARAESEQCKERFVRLQAEWDNFRKRTAAERESERKRATSNLIERLLPIIDDMERAIEHSESASEDSLKAGIVAVHSKLCDVLKKDGLETIDPVGEAFDANIHQAVGKADDPSVFDETVVQVYQKGYRMGDRVLRSAMVVVSQGGSKRPTDEVGAKDDAK